MRGRLLVVAVCVSALGLAACDSGNDANEQPQAIPAETTVATTTTVAPTTTKPKGLGVTQTYREEEPGYEGGTYELKITVFRYRDAAALEPDVESELNAKGERTVSIEVRVCLTKVPTGQQVILTWEPWSLGDDQGQSYEELQSWSGEVTTQPTYPEQKATPEGTCRRGWVPLQVAQNWRPDFVEYNPGSGDILGWPIST
jgi:hypothetical protein